MKVLLSLFAAVLLITPVAQAEQSVQIRGKTLAAEAFKRHFDYRDFSAEFEMVIRAKDGKDYKRRALVRAMRLPEDRTYSMITMLEPRDIFKTGLLTHFYDNKPDDQWLYLPARKMVSRLSATNRAQPFLSSDFAFEDLGSPGLNKYTYEFLREETLDDAPTLVIQRTPALKDSGYSRQIIWYDKDMLYPLKIDYYNPSGQLLKTQLFKDYRLLDGKYQRAHEMHMTNHILGTTTVLTWSNFKFGNGFIPRDFDLDALKRFRG